MTRISNRAHYQSLIWTYHVLLSQYRFKRYFTSQQVGLKQFLISYVSPPINSQT